MRGQSLGQCGNSGNSSEPHLHYHLQNSPVLQDGLGIRCAFEKVVVTKDGKTETRTRFSPVKDEIVSHRMTRPYLHAACSCSNTAANLSSRRSSWLLPSAATNHIKVCD